MTENPLDIIVEGLAEYLFAILDTHVETVEEITEIKKAS